MSCINSKLENKIISKKLVSRIGNPAFKFCHKIGGSPQILEFFADSKWWKLDRCIFKEKDFYVDTGYLFGKYLQSKSKEK
jgi:hypothetical protein